MWLTPGKTALVLLGLIAVLLAVLPRLPATPTETKPAAKKRGPSLADGGLEQLYAVDCERAITEATGEAARRLRDGLIARRVGKGDDPGQVTPVEFAAGRDEVVIEPTRGRSVRLTLRGDLRGVLDAADDDVVAGLAGEGFALGEQDGGSITLVMTHAEAERLRETIMSQTLEILAKRADSLELPEADIRRAGPTGVLVRLPGVDRATMQLARAVLGASAQLAFRLIETKAGDRLATVETDVAAYNKRSGGSRGPIQVQNDARFGVPLTFLRAERRSQLLRVLRFIDGRRKQRQDPPLLDDDHMLGFEAITEVDPTTQKEKRQGWRTHYVVRTMRVGVGSGRERAVSIGGHRIKRAQVAFDQQGAPYVSLDFDDTGTLDFGDLTAEHVQDFLAIMLDDEVKSAPQIEEAITGGRARITLGRASGNDSVREAQALVAVLTHGAYRAPVHRVHETVFGPAVPGPRFAGGGTQLDVRFQGAGIELNAVKEVVAKRLSALQGATSSSRVGIVELPPDEGGVQRVRLVVEPTTLITPTQRDAITQALTTELKPRSLEWPEGMESLWLTLPKPGPVPAMKARIREALSGPLGHSDAEITCAEERSLDMEFLREYNLTVSERQRDGHLVPDDDYERARAAHTTRKQHQLRSRQDARFQVRPRSLSAELERALQAHFGADRVTLESAIVFGPEPPAPAPPATEGAAGETWRRWARTAALGGLVVLGLLLVGLFLPWRRRRR